MTAFGSSNLDLTGARNAVLADNWWAVGLRGVFAILFGLIAFALPGVTMLALVFVFAAYSVADGVFNIVLAVRGASHHERWVLFLINGLFGIVVGVGAAILPGLTVLAFVLLIAAWALVSGVLSLIAAFSLTTHHGRWLLVFWAIVSIVYGLLLLATPLIGALVLTWWVGAYAVIIGATLIALAFRLRQHRGRRTPAAAAGPHWGPED
jgi:uncharacterized membrane protein HdeD (DUF308 family)